ncbi:hypothetical protein MPSEU_000031400 [Mayamaea pseudoterrestris]|nr:hypothetical protein MPSEU_000031400 [Mayamaea pseudoterrestris]
MTAAAPVSKLFSGVTISTLVVGVLAAYLSFVNRKDDIIFSNGNSFPSTPLPSTLTDEQKAIFHETGVLFIPNLLQGDLLKDAMEASERVFHRPSLWSYVMPSKYAKLSAQEWRYTKGLARVAFESSMSSMTADLLGETKSVRILKDAVFGQTSKGAGCGFHVDDKMFWPAEDDSTGVNFWIALSDYNAETGGGIRVAPKSHVADWIAPCRAVIANNTCGMSQLSPECDAKIYAMSTVYEMKPGDAVAWDRLIFHRQEPFKNVSETEHKLRYTIRYVPSNARAAVQGVLHPSVERGVPFNTPHHPQAWPTALEEEIAIVHKGLEPEITNAQRAIYISKFWVKKALKFLGK